MNDLFQKLKQEVPVPEAARVLGLTPNRAGMVRCPFHDDRTPSLRLYPDHYYCFGCHAHGDAVDLTARMTGCRPLQAAHFLVGAFHVSIPED